MVASIIYISFKEVSDLHYLSQKVSGLLNEDKCGNTHFSEVMFLISPARSIEHEITVYRKESKGSCLLGIKREGNRLEKEASYCLPA